MSEHAEDAAREDERRQHEQPTEEKQPDLRNGAGQPSLREIDQHCADRGAEFFAYEVQERLMRERIRFRPIRPRSPHLNGKVERSQRTGLEEFWPTVDLSQSDVDGQLAAWGQLLQS